MHVLKASLSDISTQSKAAFTLRAVLRGIAQCRAVLRGTALIDYTQINCSIHTARSTARHCAASRKKFETRAISATNAAQYCADYANYVVHE